MHTELKMEGLISLIKEDNELKTTYKALTEVIKLRPVFFPFLHHLQNIANVIAARKCKFDGEIRKSEGRGDKILLIKKNLRYPQKIYLSKSRVFSISL